MRVVPGGEAGRVFVQGPSVLPELRRPADGGDGGAAGGRCAVSGPGAAELEALVQTIAERIGRSLERAGLITRAIENGYLAFDPAEEGPIHGLLGYSITYRIATGPRQGQKVFMLQTLPAEPEDQRKDVAASSGFSLHAGVLAKGSERDKLEQLARYVSRPPLASERLALTESGHLRLTLKTPFRDGTTHVIFGPEDFIARLAALVPKPRAHLTRYHGIFAPHSALRDRVVPRPGVACAPAMDKSEAQRHRCMRWAQRLQRVIQIDIETCRRCGGRLRVIASIEEPSVIDRILAHLEPTTADSTRRIRAGHRQGLSCRFECI